MKTTTLTTVGSAMLCLAACALDADQAPSLSLQRSAAGLELAWPATARQADGTVVRPFFEVQRSRDLHTWQPAGERLRLDATSLDSSLHVPLGAPGPQAFYRLLSVEPPRVARLGQGGAEVFGYAGALRDERERLGQVTPAEFEALFRIGADYLPGLSWNPTTARFWDRFNLDPDQANEGKPPGDAGWRAFDTRLAGEELAVFKRNGFVVTERLGGASFGEVFHNLWHAELPVFISADALLQAWHRTYDAMLEETEETHLLTLVQAMLDGMAAQVPSAWAVVTDGVLRDSLRDADYFLAVARSLLAGANRPPASSFAGQEALVSATLRDVAAEAMKQVDDFMGFCRVVDYSQFKPRGHYTHSERLSRYFQCLMWLGRIDVPVAGRFSRCPEGEREASPRELGLAIVLWHLVHAAGQFEAWAEMERTIAAFVGPTDSLTFGQLNGLLAGAGIQTLADVRGLDTLQRIRDELERGELGVQSIRSDWFQTPFGASGHAALPRAFTVFGQKFALDSWALSQSVFDSIDWDGGKVPRRVPGALDVAFSVLGNNQVVPELLAQIRGAFPNPDRPHAAHFRDGFPYQHQLAALRGVLDGQTPSAWEGNLYNHWLAALRELSPPTTDLRYPEAMRTRAWALKTVNTQLASWTHLRHDTVLYVKQSFTAVAECQYPTGYVEPRPEFWERFRRCVEAAADAIRQLRPEGTYGVERWQEPQFDPGTGQETAPGEWRTEQIALTAIRDRQVAHLDRFAAVIRTLQALVTKELAQERFTPEEDLFIDSLIEQPIVTGGCVGLATYRGWYPALFYRRLRWWDDFAFDRDYGAGAYDALVADVHTDVPTDSDPGSVLHEAVGRVNLLMLAVDSGTERFICAGPVLSHYELETIGSPRRLNDLEWRKMASDLRRAGEIHGGAIEGLAPPPWTRSYLVPQP